MLMWDVSFSSKTPLFLPTPDNYSDWKIGLTQDFGNGLSGSIAATGTNAKDTFNGSNVWNFNGTGYLGDTKGIVSLTKTF